MIHTSGPSKALVFWSKKIGYHSAINFIYDAVNTTEIMMKNSDHQSSCNIWIALDKLCSNFHSILSTIKTCYCFYLKNSTVTSMELFWVTVSMTENRWRSSRIQSPFGLMSCLKDQGLLTGSTTPRPPEMLSSKYH